MQYELFYLVAGSKEPGLEKIKKEVKEMVSEEGASFEPKETTEKRRLAYKINHETFGIYNALRFNLEDSEKIASISRKLNLYPEVLRFIVSRASDLPELMNREERIEASNRIARKEEQQAEAKKVSEEPKKTKKRDEKEDIDKKLEEILNI